MIRRLKHYQVMDKIGSGGMATVYRGRNSSSGAQVAIKVMHPFLAEKPDYVERFRREASTAMALDCPNIVKVLDCGEDVGTYFIVMEYVKGRTVHQAILDAHGPLSIPLALDVAVQVCMALDCAHQRGVVHRDIKPHNIMLTEDGTAKVMDFGIARVAGFSTMTQTGAFIGSPHYMSPEQAQGKHVDIRSDIYSLGIALYHMLTGTVPFNAETPWAIMEQHVRREPVAPGRLRGDLPPGVDALVRRALAKEPGRRFQTPADMLEALRRLGVQRLAVGAAAPLGPTQMVGSMPTPGTTPISARSTPVPGVQTPAPIAPLSSPVRTLRRSAIDGRAPATAIAVVLLFGAAGIVGVVAVSGGGRSATTGTPLPTIAALSSAEATAHPSSTSTAKLIETPIRPPAPLPTLPPTSTLAPMLPTSTPILTPTETPAPVPTRTPSPVPPNIATVRPSNTPIPPSTPTTRPSDTPVPHTRLAAPDLTGHGPGTGDTFTQQHSTVGFSWTPIAGLPEGAYYEILLWWKQDGKQQVEPIPIKKGTTWQMPQGFWDLPDDGRYDWHIRVRAADGTELSDPSPARWFRWINVPPPPPPTPEVTQTPVVRPSPTR